MSVDPHHWPEETIASLREWANQHNAEPKEDD